MTAPDNTHHDDDLYAIGSKWQSYSDNRRQQPHEGTIYDVFGRLQGKRIYWHHCPYYRLYLQSARILLTIK